MRPNEFFELHAFVVIAEEKSFRRAATRLALTPSTLSHAIRALEERHGVRLLNRTTRSVSVTEPGAALLAQIGPAYTVIQQAADQISVASELPRGPVRINTPQLAAELVFGSRLGEFARLYPNVDLDIAVEDAFVDVVGKGFDAGIRLGESLHQDMIATRVTSDLRIAVVGSPDYFSANGTPIDGAADLAHHRCIGYRAKGGRGIYKWEFEKDGRSVNIVPGNSLVLDSHALLVQAALAGAGLAYAIESMVAEELSSGRLVRVLDDWCQPFPGFYIYHPSRRQMSTALRSLIDFVRV